MGKIFFIDFDGTITKTDTCNAMVEAFARDGWEELNRLWEEKKLSTEECANRTLELFNANIDDLKTFIEKIEIDDYFTEFLGICKNKGYEVYVLSDGYDFNIETIFKKYGISIPYFSNKLLYSPEEGFKMKCIYNNPSCGICGTCKTNLVNKLKGNGNKVIYIGDGYSDTCAAANADTIFAKGTLYRYCISKGIKAVNFSNFRDIISRELV